MGHSITRRVALTLLMLAAASLYVGWQESRKAHAPGQDASVNFLVLQVGDFHAEIRWND